MPFLEVYSPKGAVPAERRRRISERLVPEVMDAEGAPDNEFVRSLSWLVWHEPEIWTVGGRGVDGEAPRYVVRVSMPAASLTEEKRAKVVARVTKVLAEEDESPDRFYSAPPISFVLIDPVPEGNWGSAGMVLRFPDIASYALTGAPGQLTDEQVSEVFGLDDGAVAEPASAPAS